MRRILALLPLVALLATMAVGPDAASGWERFNLFNACRPMQLVIEYLDDDATEIGLTREMLKAAAGKPPTGGAPLCRGRLARVRMARVCT